MSGQFSIGVDYGTNSVRAVVVDVRTGEEKGASVWNYHRGNAGVIEDPRDVHLARQHPVDYTEGFLASVSEAMQGIDPEQIVGIGIDTTGSTPIPVNASGHALALQERFTANPNAMAWLWKDHAGHAEAAEITELAKRQGRPYLDKCGGTYSSEWYWSKILRCARVAPDVFEAAANWVELADYVPAWLTGTLANPRRSVCAAGHKAMYHREWGGLPALDFLQALHPWLRRYYEEAVPSDQIAGYLIEEIAGRIGLKSGIPVAVGAFDAHMGAVGSGVKPGTLVKIMGTSTCDILVGDASTPDIVGVCGVVPGSVIPGMMGIEAGQSAVGDLFNWWVSILPLALRERGLGGEGTTDLHQALQAQAAHLRPGESGLLALDWNNGNRTILVDPLLSGLLVGQSLHTTAAEVYRALIEATAFGALTIIRRIEESRVRIDEVVVCGGIAEKSPLTMQIYADVCNRPMKVAASAQTCALGAAIFGTVASGAHPDTLTAQAAMVAPPKTTYTPTPSAVAVYAELYELYMRLHDAFGSRDGVTSLAVVMKTLLAIRERSRMD